MHFKIESRVANLACNGLREGTGTEGNVWLVNGEAVVHCTQQARSDLDFIDKIKITLTYDYKEFIEKNLLVKKSLS